MATQVPSKADQSRPYYTLAEGRPVADPTSATILRGTHGRLRGGLGLLEDTQLIETLAHFARERIPERVVHAKAAGAWGAFEVTHDLSAITSCGFLTGVGKRTPVLARISTVAGEKGSADTARDVRGFAVKFFTADAGNQDLVMNDLPVFFVRDPVKFPSVNRAHKRHPQTAVPDATMFWDFHNNNQEGTHALMQLFSGRGVPASLRHVSAFGVHTYKLGKPEDGTFKYIKWHFKPDGGIETLTAEEATRLAGSDPDYHVRDLYNAIASGDHPSWTVYLQVMDPADAEAGLPYDIFDATRVWPHADYPLRPVGRLTLDRNPANYFQDVEQAAFSPSAMVPGLGPSADLVLQARMFAYPDAQRYRVGPNYQQLPCNAARSTVYSPYQRDGPATINGNYGGDPDYVRSSFRPIQEIGPTDVSFNAWSGKVEQYSSKVTDDDFTQPRELWKVFKRDGTDGDFIHNVSGHMAGAIKEVQDKAIEVWAKVDDEIAQRIRKNLDENPKTKPSHVWSPNQS
ncbi:catalase [Xylariaceae sp. FL0804]|nr:catalase [Xylariaceae sp. FL0804]